MRRIAKTDANQSEIVKQLRQCGVTVQPLHQVGKGVPDLLCGFRGVNILIEAKDGEKVPSKQKLTVEEREWHDTWGGQVDTASSFQEAMDVILRHVGMLERKAA